MAAPALYNKWRPQTFADIIGQERVARTLRNALARPEQLAHAYLFCGPRGTGKTTTARILAKAVNCRQGLQPEPCNQCDHCQAVNRGAQFDLMIEIDGASHTGVDDIRDLREKVSRRPGEGRYKVYIIDEVHMLSTSAFNALLKTLEEPPPHVIFVLATTNPEKIPATVLSRCQRFDFKPVSAAKLVHHLRSIAGREGLHVEPEALELMARSATGSVRDALSLLDQAAAFAGRTITSAQLREMLGLSDQDLVLGLADALLDSDLSAALDTIQAIVERGADLREFDHQFVEFLRAMLLTRSGVVAPPIPALGNEAADAINPRSRRVGLATLVQWIQLFVEAENGIRSATVQPQLSLELAAVQSVLVTRGEAVPREMDHAATPAMPPPAAVATPEAPVARRAARPEPAVPGQSRPAEDGAAQPASVRIAAPLVPEPATPSVAASPKSAVPGKATPPAAQALTDALVREQWPAVLHLLGHRQRVTALLRDAQVAAVRGDEVILEFPFPFHAEQVEKPERRLLVEKALGRILDRTVRVRAVVKGQEAQPEGPGSGGPLQDPVVRHALTVFPDATIIESSGGTPRRAAARRKDSDHEHEDD